MRRAGEVSLQEAQFCATPLSGIAAPNSWTTRLVAPFAQTVTWAKPLAVALLISGKYDGLSRQEAIKLAKELPHRIVLGVTPDGTGECDTDLLPLAPWG